MTLQKFQLWLSLICEWNLSESHNKLFCSCLFVVVFAFFAFVFFFFCGHGSLIHSRAAELLASLVTPITMTNSCMHSSMASDPAWETNDIAQKKTLLPPHHHYWSLAFVGNYTGKKKCACIPGCHCCPLPWLLLYKNHRTSAQAQRISLNAQVLEQRY